MLRVSLLCAAALALALHAHLLLAGRAAPQLRLLRARAPCAPRGLSPHVLVYNRLEKTGSSTLYKVIDALAARNNFTHVRVADLHNASAARAAIAAALLQPQRALVSEHFAFPELEEGAEEGLLLPEGALRRVAYMQVVREPAARCVSWYHWSRYSWVNPWTAANLAAHGNATLDACAASADQQRCLNCPPLHQAQAFCGANGGACFDGSLGSRAVLQRAARIIDAHYPVVGLTERLEDSLALLEAAFPGFFAGALGVLRHPGFRSARVFKGRAAGYPQPSNATLALLSQRLRGEEQLYASLAARLAGQLACLAADA